ncbi:hypothetical protein SAMN05444369_10963 [Capnocytophaga haemolytica]|uniref:DUF2262 domain-containing protein n=1 Tax=Capnocytophaga haemolytica TaxID=45243 RepID=A0AAX2H020_9FLAO|nr:hypothetical protein [Capnocytophaga haemolytica]AMD84410.1 hypothetical protein AXF12_01980 [Capnocytophaga haemolytica]SFO10304.1 hypothetical protein SAMN05444369_10963 [Capnocytophaga haemolytica]SNV10717.1 Uncharacterised protein [Capnocytophaga haemolytica]
MKEITINELKKHKSSSGAYRLETTLKKRKIEVEVEPDGEDLSEVLPLVNNVLNKLELLDVKAKKFLADQHTETYNDEIRDGDEPYLDEKAFEKHLKLNNISVVGDQLMFFYGGVVEDIVFMACSSDGEVFDESEILD